MKNLRYESVVTALLPAIVILGILLLRPHWGLMDDSLNIFTIVPDAEKTGLFRYAWKYALDDLTWGMFRPTYPLLCWFIYKPGMLLGSTAGFLWNAVLSLLAIWYTARVFSRIVGLSLAEVLIVNGAVFYQYDLFQHPSLQEKLVIAVGAAFVSACWERNGWKTWAKIMVWFLIGVATKASFMIYFCLGFWALLAAREKELLSFRALRPWAEVAVVGLLGVALLGFYIFVSKRGSYTSHYFEASIWPNLLTPFGPMFLIPIATFIAAVVYTGAWRTGGLRIFLPSLGVLAFLAVFLRWGIGGYVESVIGTVFACLLVQNAHLWFARFPRAAWLVPISALAIAVASYRTYGSFVRLHDISAFLDQAPLLAREGVKEVWMPCHEGSASVQRYLDGRGVQGLQVRESDEGADGRIYFYDRALCHFPDRGEAPAGCTAEPVWTGLWSRSFRVSRMHCGSKGS